jgi:hypothetical protein
MSAQKLRGSSTVSRKLLFLLLLPLALLISQRVFAQKLSSVDICRAIENRVVLVLKYSDDPVWAAERTIHPYAVGRSPSRNIIVFAWQAGGYSSSANSNDAQGWRSFRLDRVNSLVPSTATFRVDDAPFPSQSVIQNYVCRAHLPAKISEKPKVEIHNSERVTRITNLYPHNDCARDKQPTRGKVVERDFEKDGVSVSSITLEENDGSRTLINLSFKRDDVDQATLGWLIQGLQRLSRMGNTVQVRVKLCGAAGRVLMLDQISESNR